MRQSSRNKLVLLATTCAIALVAIPNAQAENGWGWKKPLNQKLGLFYTSNKAFKRPKSSSRNGRLATSYPAYTVTPIYSQLPTQTTIVQPVPIQQAHVQVQATHATSPAKPVPKTTRSAAERALELLQLEPVIGPATPITTTPITTTPSNTTPSPAPITSTPPATVTKGAVRIASPSSPSSAEPLQIQSTSYRVGE